jgi:uncharacterized protein (DUF433 family)/uncharacterized protein YuzE
MRIRYDPEVDALSIAVRDATATTQELADGIAAAYDTAGKLVGIKILDAGKRFGDPSALRDVALQGLGSAASFAVDKNSQRFADMAAVATGHVRLDDQGRAWIDDTNVKVIEVVMDHAIWKWSPEAIHLQHPHLSLAQIHAALAYYYDHQAEFDAEIERQEREYQALHAAQGNNTPLHQKLPAAGQLP